MALLEDTLESRTLHAQSLDEFRANAAATLERINRTGEAEELTVDGEVRGVVLSRAAYAELLKEAQLRADVETMRKSMAEIDEGRYTEAGEFFDKLRARLLEMQAAKQAGPR